MSHDDHMSCVTRVMVANLVHNAYFKYLTGMCWLSWQFGVI